MFCVDLTFESLEGAMVFRVYIFIFYLEPTLGKDSWMRATSAAVMVIFFESVILNVT